MLFPSFGDRVHVRFLGLGVAHMLGITLLKAFSHFSQPLSWSAIAPSLSNDGRATEITSMPRETPFALIVTKPRHVQGHRERISLVECVRMEADIEKLRAFDLIWLALIVFAAILICRVINLAAS